MVLSSPSTSLEGQGHESVGELAGASPPSRQLRESPPPPRRSFSVSNLCPKAATGLASHEPLVLTGLMGAGSARNQLGVPGGVLRSPEPPILKTTCVETPPSLNSLSCSVPVAPTPITGPRVEDLTCGGPCRCVERW